MNLHNPGSFCMSQWEIQALQANFDNWQKSGRLSYQPTRRLSVM